MHVSPLVGKPATPSMLVNLPWLITAYYTERPDPAIHEQRVAFCASGHRGSAQSDYESAGREVNVQRSAVGEKTA